MMGIAVELTTGHVVLLQTDSTPRDGVRTELPALGCSGELLSVLEYEPEPGDYPIDHEALVEALYARGLRLDEPLHESRERLHLVARVVLDDDAVWDALTSPYGPDLV